MDINQTINQTNNALMESGSTFFRNLFYYSQVLAEKFITLIGKEIPLSKSQITAIAVFLDILFILLLLKFANRLRPILKIILILLLIYIGIGFFLNP